MCNHILCQNYRWIIPSTIPLSFWLNHNLAELLIYRYKLNLCIVRPLPCIYRLCSIANARENKLRSQLEETLEKATQILDKEMG